MLTSATRPCNTPGYFAEVDTEAFWAYNSGLNSNKERNLKDYIVYTDEGELILSAPNLETAYELANEWDLDIVEIKLAERLN